MAAIKINGVEYELPEQDSLTTGELMYQYRYASRYGIAGDELPNICVFLGMIHVAIMRAKPTTPQAEVESAILEIPITEVERMIGELNAQAPSSSPLAQSNADSPDSNKESLSPDSDASPDNNGQASIGDPTSGIGSESAQPTLTE